MSIVAARNEMKTVPKPVKQNVAAQHGDSIQRLRRAADILQTCARNEQAYMAAVDCWIAAVDERSIDEWSSAERRQMERTLIEQPGVDVRPPILHHRISAQHASGIECHLTHAAEALEPLLGSMLESGQDSPNLVLMLLLLRSRLKQIDQQHITELHRRHFKSFPVEYLAIPYSVMFHCKEYVRNVDDLAELVDDQFEAVSDGSWPLTHLLHAYWLTPASFAPLPESWWATAVQNRATKLGQGGQEGAAARSLALRLDDSAQNSVTCGADSDFTSAVRDLAERRGSFAQRTSTSERAAARLDSTAHRATNVVLNLAGSRAPFLFGVRRKPKVAICVSGQLRGFRSAFGTWKRLMLPAIDATIFVSSWKRIGRASPEPFRYVLPFAGASFTQAYKAVGTALGLTEMKERYPSLYCALDASADITEEELSQIYDTAHVHLDDEAEPQFAVLSNAEKMHYKIEHAFRMAVDSREQFDLFVRIRPDKPVRMVGFSWNDLADATGGLARLYAETGMGVHFGALEIGDQFAAGGLAASRVYSETWSSAADYSRFGLRMFHRELTGHVSLAQMCWLHGVEVRRVPMKFGSLQDPEPLDVAAVHGALLRDGAARMDRIDRRLLAAIEADALKRR